ncbi:orotidine-5'-phosphate decarboxylase [Calycomorphotria hydatis]|uniref:Orotidine 5'-phosphate decarboxylase n=1 Tax=Calycomorphotria hydatis TaxID=2528027 RepID=A0A517TCC1_9PLAN|nr:orotidine-5'-phosphate decarboxylase [Calycomorphotria hydatis]QDT66017.1 Orotidine 5'-phosphate decarboxylase [Calycomorphotria hydatis]
MTNFADRLHAAIQEKQTPALIGLDPRIEQLPPAIVEKATENYGTTPEAHAAAFEKFCCRLIDVIAPLVPVVKPQSAFFEELGPAGMVALARVTAHARKAGLLVILDAKRGDIGSTAEAYSRGLLGGINPEYEWQADALTVNPYLGVDTLEPFVNVAVERGAGIYVLVRTSNPGSGAFQNLTDRESGQSVYRHVASAVEQLASQHAEGSDYGPIGAVVGATYPQELAELREAMPHVPLLIPGYGSQGGTAADVAAGFDDQGLGAVVNSSRGINFAFRKSPYKEQFGEDQWEAAAEAATRDMIKDLATHTPAGVLQE